MEQVAPIASATVGRPAAFSTAELLRHERVALQLAAHGRQVSVPTVSPATVEEVARERGPMLGREQVAMVHAAASSPERVVCVVGHAGAGKTTALAALADAYQRDGYVAIGAAPSGVAAANLAAETGIPSGTLHRLLAEARQRGGLPRQLPARRRRGGDGRHPHPHPRPLAGGACGGEGGAGRRPGPASRRRPGRPVQRDRRAQRRDRAARQPPPARRARTARARPPPRRPQPRLPRPRRPAGEADRCGRSGRGEGAAGRRLVAGRARRPRRAAR